VKRWFQANHFYTAPGVEHTAAHTLKSAEAIDEQTGALEPLLQMARKMPLNCPNASEVDAIRRRMQNESEALKGMAAAATSIEPMELEKVIARCELTVQVPLLAGAENSMAQKDVESMQEVLEQARRQGFLDDPERWLPELNGREVFRDLAEVLAALEAGKAVDVEKLQQERDAALEAAPQKKQSVAHVKSVKSARSTKGQGGRGRKSTITGLTEDDQTALLLGLMGAMEVCDIHRIEELLNDAMKEGVSDREVLREAQAMYKNLSSEAWVVEAVESRRQELDGPSRDGTALKAVQNLLKQAQRLQVAPEVIEPAKEAVRKQIRIRARATVTGKLFQEIDVEELQLMDNSFANLADFPGLKSPLEWRGHKAPSFFSFGASGPDVMLAHHNLDIKEALTRVDYGLEGQCITMFSNMLGWMYDRPVPEIQRAGLMDEIVNLARQDQSLADEVYVQAMKQLTGNPSTRSEVQGWKLLHTLCQHVCPSAALFEFVHVFLLGAIRRNRGNHEAAEAIKQCVADLNISASSEAGRGEDLVPFQVALIDSSVRRVRVPQSSTLAQLVEITAAQLGIHRAQDFALFQVTDGMEAHRLLPEATVVASLMQRLKKLQDMTKRSSRLLFKRKFMKVDEHLRADDLSHAMLTYRQAVSDFIHYPLEEDLRAILEISARVMLVERDYFRPHIEQGTLADAGVLEQVVPAVILAAHARRRLAQNLTELYMRTAETIDHNEQRLITMSRALSLMQRLRLFGAYYWTAKQIDDVPEAKRSVQDAPKAMCRINPQAQDATYVIAVDYFGLRFLTTGDLPGSLFQKGFLFNEEAVERLLVWGACQNVAQFVVTTVDPSQRFVGRVPMTIAMLTPAAVDIAFAVHMVYVMKGITEQRR